MDSNALLLFCGAGALAGLVGAWLMNGLMLLVSARIPQRINMVAALGAMLTGKADLARGVGTWVHTASGTLFGLIYAAVILQVAEHGAMMALLVGLIMGLVHGLFISYGLMFFIAERHPVERYRKATAEVGAVHFLGHLFFGAFVGIVLSLVLVALTGDAAANASPLPSE